MFSPVSVCLSVCLSVNREMLKTNGQNFMKFMEWLDIIQGSIN